MDELRNYVNFLFAHYMETKQIKELKEEILSNLEARTADMVSAGIGEAEAVEQAKQSISSIDELIDGNKKIYICQFRLEWLQWILIYLISACIVSIPMLMFHIGALASTLLFLAVIITAILYIYFISQKHRHTDHELAYVNLEHIKKIRKMVWLFWIAFTLVCSAATTAMYFGSNIWFARRVSINGPYELAVIIILYAVPFFTVVIPLSVNKMPALVFKYEVQNNEKEK